MKKISGALSPYIPAKIKARFSAGEKKPAPVSVVRLSGTIGNAGRFGKGLSLESVNAQLEAAFKPKKLSAVVLVINSPGGSPVQSSLIGKRIRALASEKYKKDENKPPVPVYAFVEDVAASGGYWLACAADEIYLDESSMVGSIGVIAAGFGFDKAIAKYGVERRAYTAGENKLRLDPFQQEKKEDVVWVRELQTQIHEIFCQWVRTRRAGRLKGDEKDLMNGNVWIGQNAVALGLADGIGDVRSIMRAKFGDKVELKPIQGKKSLGAKLGLKAGFTPNPGGPVTELAAALPAETLSAVEERLAWNRFGL